MTDLQALLDTHQSTRLLRLSFPRDDGPQARLMVNRFEGAEYLSRDFEFRVELLSDDAGIQLEAMHGKLLCVSLVQADGSLRPFTGYVASFKLVKTDGGMVLYEAVLMPWLAYTRLRRNNRLFHAQSLSEQAETVFAGYGSLPVWDWKVGGEQPQFTMATQWDETDHNYLCRRWEAAGYSYYYEHHGDGHTLMVGDDTRTVAPIDGPSPDIRFHRAGGADEEDAIGEWSPLRQWASAQVAVSGFDFKNPQPVHADTLTLNQQGDIPQLEVYSYEGHYGFKHPSGAYQLAQLRMEEIEARGKLFTAQGNNRRVSLGINLIGVVPMPPGMGAARMSLRPALHLARQKLALGAKDLGAAMIEVLIVHLNARLAGEIDTFVDSALGKLTGILDECADLADGIADDLIKILKCCIGEEPLFELACPAQVETKLHNPKVASSWRRMLGALGRQYKKTANYAVAAAARHLPQSAVTGVTGIIGHLTDFKPALRGKLAALADEQAQMSIRWILVRLRDAVIKHKKRHAALVPSAKGADHKKNNPGHELGATSRQSPAKGDANACKLCPAQGGTAHSISFATGAENFTHLDFVLDAPIPIAWSRTYRSQLIAYDRAHLGARWLTPYSTRVDVVGQGKPASLLYHAGDGRSHRYPWLAIGQRHYDPVEQIMLTRMSATLLTLDFGKMLPEGEPSPWRETYELVDTVRGKVADLGKEHFRLVALHAKDGAAVGLRYDHVVAHGPHAGEQVLSDIVSKQGETIVAHVGTQIDASSGRIRALWEIKDGKLVRQLAAYDYDDHGDLVRAQDENGAAWLYQYERHLVTRYTDRTGRGMNLAYDTSIDSGLHARAIREWADDGSYDSRLEWDRNIRLTCVLDALGHETRYYYDIAGYTYRTVYPDGREEWFFRDDAKNIVRHIHTDGSSEHYRYDEHGDLLTHTRADGSEVHFEYDDEYRTTAIRDADGGTWRRDYNAQGHLVEQTDPRGNKTEYAYDKAGRSVEVTDARGGVTKLAYTADGQFAGYTDCSGQTSQREYDERKRLIKSIDAAGNVTRYRYTPLSAETLALARSEGNHPGQLEAVIHPDGSEEQLRHDAEGRLLAHTDQIGRTTAYRYTAAGRIAKRIDALGHGLHYRWDALGRLSALENENGSVYRFQYDPVGRLLQEQGFDGKATAYRYDEATGVLAETVETGVTTRLDFDTMGRLMRRRATATGQPEQVETFAYTVNGQLAEAHNDHARLQWFYDAAGNLVREHQHYQGPFHLEKRTAVWHHRYDELNQRTGTTRPDGHRIEWLTYGAGHVHGMLLDEQELVSFERDALYQETSRTQANGLRQTMKYDPAGRLIEQQLGAIAQANRKDPHFYGGQPHLGAQVGMQAAILRRYRYDPSGQLTSIEDSRRGRIDYRYDPVGRLLAANSVVGHETFAFDPAGNIQAAPSDQQESISSRVQLPKLLDNLLKEYAGASYRYDERGNLIERMRNAQRDTFE